MDSITIKPLSWTHPDATLLRTAQQQEINGTLLLEPGHPPSAADVPIFFVAYSGTEPVGCGGLRPLADQGLPGQAEIKRMYVVPSQRKASGVEAATSTVAISILRALEGAAREHGWMVLKLETGKRMGRSRRFYEKCGFVECGTYGSYERAEESVFYEKALE